MNASLSKDHYYSSYYGSNEGVTVPKDNYGQEFVKNCKTDVANERLYLRNLDNFALSIVLYWRHHRHFPDCLK